MKKIIVFILLLLVPALAYSEVYVREVAKKWDAVTVTINTDWFASDIVVGTTAQRRSVGVDKAYFAPVKHTFQFSCPTATVINLQLKFDSITKIFNFNSGLEIGINGGNQFSVMLHRDMTYNIQHKTATQACAVVITESFNVDL